MAFITIPISQLPIGSPKLTDYYPAVDTTDTTQAITGTTKRYSLESLSDFLDLGFQSARLSCRVATIASLVSVYQNGTLGVGATLVNNGAQAPIAIDGITLAVGDRVLVKDQSANTQNGSYVISSIGSGTTNWVMTRTDDYDNHTVDSVVQGTFFAITEGTVNHLTFWIETAPSPIVIGTDPIIFAQSVADDNVTAGTGLVRIGDVISLIVPVSPEHGGTGVNNGVATITLNGGDFSTTGGFDLNLNTTGNTSVTLPTSGTLASAVTWNVITGVSQSMSGNNGYITNNAGVVTLSMPVTATVGETFYITGFGSGGWAISQQASQQINFGDLATTVGGFGGLASTNQFDTITIVCVVANTSFNVLSSIGNITVV